MDGDCLCPLLLALREVLSVSKGQMRLSHILLPAYDHRGVDKMMLCYQCRHESR